MSTDISEREVKSQGQVEAGKLQVPLASYLAAHGLAIIEILIL